MLKIIAVDPGNKEVILTQGYVAIIDESDFVLVSQYKWQVVHRRHTKYAKRAYRLHGEVKTEYMHVTIMGEKGIDHVDGNGLNNRRSNLRKASQHQNNGNYIKRKGKSKYKGVCWDQGKWKAAISRGCEKYHSGRFENEEDAARAYDVAAKDYFGEFANLNFPC